MPLCHYATTAYRRELLPNRTRASQLQREHNHTPNPDPNTQGETHPTTVQEHLPKTAKDRTHGRLTLADASDITRDGNQHSFHQVNHSVYMYCRSLQMLCPQLKELSLYFTASPHRPSHHLSGAAVHRSTLARTARGNAVLQRWRAERPEKSGVPENNIPGP